MRIVPLSCSHCGAPLRVPESTRFVTCVHCHSQLAVHHEGAAVFTEALGEIAARTANIEEHLAEMQIAKDLERVDAAWEKERKEILVGGEKGAPAKGMVWLTSFVLMLIGISIFLPLTGGRRGLSGWVLLVPVTVPWFVGWIVAMQVDRYEESEGYYRRIRQLILHRRGRLRRYARRGPTLDSAQPEQTV